MLDERRMRDERRKQIIEVWRTIVGVQQHFNDISMRIRSMFVTILLALFASLGFLLDRKLNLKFWAINIQFATFIPIFGIGGAYLFYFIDRYWYHRLLVGSVKHAIIIEKKYKNEMPELCLSEAIGAESPYRPRGLARWVANRVVGDDKYRTTGLLHSDGKIEFFYKSVMLALTGTAILLALLGGIYIDRSVQPTATRTTVDTTPSPPACGSDSSSACTNTSKVPRRTN